MITQGSRPHGTSSRLVLAGFLIVFVILAMGSLFARPSFAQTSMPELAQEGTPTPVPPDVTTPITQTATAPQGNAENLVLMIDTLVHYGAYFLLGLGLILFLLLILFFVYLARRSRDIARRQGPRP